jgi:hypothetical protein
MTIDEALNRLITRASTLISAIDGVTNQFADEISELNLAIVDGWDALDPTYRARQTACPLKLPEFNQQTAYHVSFLAPAGVYRDLVVADTPDQALRKAMQLSESKEFKPAFDPDDNALRIHQITVQHPDGEEQAVWTDPDNIAQLHADQILELLEGMIEAADQLSDQKHAFENSVYEMVSGGEQAALSLKTIHREGGVQ